MRGTSPEETAMDLVIEDDSRVGCVFFLMSEDNVRREIQLPWVSFGSDGGSMAPKASSSIGHPPARLRQLRPPAGQVRPRGEAHRRCTEAIRRLTSLPADNLKLARRGRLAPGCFADIVVFDPATIIDHATFDQPHQYATGVQHVFVNGVQVLRDGEHTGAAAGRVVRGPGYRAAAN